MPQRLARLVVGAVLALSSAASVRGEDSFLFANENRFYIAPIVGASWGTLNLYEPAEPGEPAELEPVMNGNLFTAGGAAGVAFARDRGQLRLEFEGRYRDNFGISREVVLPRNFAASLQATDNWSTMANAWRDFSVTDRLGIYGGGGIGAGGYGLSLSASPLLPNEFLTASNTTAFAWQAGGGVLYAFSERITLDLGYRFYSVGPGNSTLQANIPGLPVSQVASTTFASSELLLSLRIYEPFRSWR